MQPIIRIMYVRIDEGWERPSSLNSLSWRHGRVWTHRAVPPSLAYDRGGKGWTPRGRMMEKDAGRESQVLHESSFLWAAGVTRGPC